MHGVIPKAIDAQGFLSQQGIRQLMANAAQFGLSGGVNDSVGSQGITPVPQLADACFAIIDDSNGNKHAWAELSLFYPDNPVRMVGGRFGTIDTDSSSESESSSSDADGTDYQAAWGLNGENYATGTIVYVVRINYNAWGIIGSSSDSSSDNSFCFSVDCEAGTIIVTDCNSTTGTDGTGTSSSKTSSSTIDIDPTRTGGRPGVIDTTGGQVGGEAN